MAVLITSHVQVSLGNKYNSYIHSAPNAKVTSVRNIYEKTNETEEQRFSEAYLEPSRTLR